MFTVCSLVFTWYYLVPRKTAEIKLEKRTRPFRHLPTLVSHRFHRFPSFHASLWHGSILEHLGAFLVAESLSCSFWLLFDPFASDVAGTSLGKFAQGHVAERDGRSLLRSEPTRKIQTELKPHGNHDYHVVLPLHLLGNHFVFWRARGLWSQWTNHSADTRPVRPVQLRKSR
jgi:hypothetical protein